MKDDQKEKLIKKLLSKKGRKAAIDAKCCECIYDPISIGHGSWRKQVEDCTSRNCPLYEYRPCTVSGKSDDDEPEHEEETNGS